MSSEDIFFSLAARAAIGGLAYYFYLQRKELEKLEEVIFEEEIRPRIPESQKPNPWRTYWQLRGYSRRFPIIERIRKLTSMISRREKVDHEDTLFLMRLERYMDDYGKDHDLDRTREGDLEEYLQQREQRAREEELQRRMRQREQEEQERIDREQEVHRAGEERKLEDFERKAEEYRRRKEEELKAEEDDPVKKEIKELQEAKEQRRRQRLEAAKQAEEEAKRVQDSIKKEEEEIQRARKAEQDRKRRAEARKAREERARQATQQQRVQRAQESKKGETEGPPVIKGHSYEGDDSLPSKAYSYLSRLFHDEEEDAIRETEEQAILMDEIRRLDELHKKRQREGGYDLGKIGESTRVDRTDSIDKKDAQ